MVRFARCEPAWFADGVVDVRRERFEELVAEALDGIPEQFTKAMRNVAVFVEDVAGQTRTCSGCTSASR